MKSILGTAAAITILLTVLSGCGGGDSGGTPFKADPGGTATGAASGAGSGAGGICGLLSAAEAGEITGVRIARTSSESSQRCAFLDDSGTEVLSYLREVNYSSDTPQQVMDGITVNGHYQPVTGIGDAAVFAPGDSLSGYSLFFTKRENEGVVLLQLSIATEVPGVSREMAETAARALEPKV